MKPCNDCHEIKPLDAFPKNWHMRDGRINTCKSCWGVRYRGRYKRDRERARINARNWRASHHEAYKEYQREYHRRWYASRRASRRTRALSNDAADPRQ